MPKTKETSNHPCHFLSLPSAKRFWCRHCMSVFEDAITRWRHSRSCRYGVVNNFMRRRQLEAKALQNTTKPNPIEARLEHSVCPSGKPTVFEEGQEGSSTGGKSNQSTSNDLFRCFICHNRFSSLEEMRHHVKYPCNNKKIITDVPNPAMTVYIDEFTDRSRHWDPQPQQEEVISSELIPNIVSQETVHSVDHVKTEISWENKSSDNKQKLTPTNIYVNEQGETVIEVENLDLNSEGGELSLAHLLTQLSQQGIVFDKTKASQMQAQQEMTVSDPASGEIYASGSSFEASSSTQTIVREEDEGQPTAEDAANTLAQLAVFRGYRTNQETYEGTNMTTDLQSREFVVEGTNGSYTYAIPSTTSGDQLTLGNTECHANLNVEYNYLPSDQSAAIVSTTSQLPLQSSYPINSTTSPLNSIGVGKELNNIQSVPTLQVQQHDVQPQVVTYISSPSAQQTQTQDMQEETMLIEDYVVEDPISAISSEQHHLNVNIPDGIKQNQFEQASIPAMLETSHHNSYIVFSTDDSSTQIMCNPQGNQNELNIRSNCVSDSILSNVVIPNNRHQQYHYISTSKDVVREDINEEIKDTEEFEVQTVTLQEIAEEESSGRVSFGQNPSTRLCTQPTSNIDISNSANSSSNELQQHTNQCRDQCIQLDILQQTAGEVVNNNESFTVAIEHQQPSREVSSVSTSMPVYVMSPHGSLQLLATSHTPPTEDLVPSNSSQSQV